MWKLSRYWNRIAYFVVDCGIKMLWDQTGKNGDILGDYVASETTRAILTDQ